MRIKLFYPILALGMVGCEKSPTLPMHESPIVEACDHSSEEDAVNTVGDRQKREQIEKILGRNLREIPFSKRYDAVLEKATDLWGVLDGMTSSNASYVIFSVARLQKELEDEFNSTMALPDEKEEMSTVSQDGVRYLLADKEQALGLKRKSREALEMKEYRRQLQHFLSLYPQRIDSPHIRTIIERMPQERRACVIAEIERILGKNPYPSLDNNTPK